MTEKPSPFDLRFEQRDKYLYVSVTGPEDSLEVSRAYCERAKSRAEELGVKTLLFEEDFPNQISTLDMFDMARFVARLFPTPFKVAYVDRQASDMDLNEFGGIAATNRGCNIRVFHSFEDAERWLTDLSNPRMQTDAAVKGDDDDEGE